MPRLSLGLGVQTIRKVGGFSPGNLSGLSLWLKADAGVSLSGSNVTAWADQSGTSKNMFASGGNEPIFIASELNGKPVIDFATNKYLTASFSSTNFTQQTVFVVFKFVSENLSTFARTFSQSNIDYNDYQTPGNLLPLIRKDGTDDMWCYSPQGDTFLASLPTSNNTWYISTTKTNGSNGSFLLNGNNQQSFSAEFNADITNMRVGGAIFEGGSFNDPFNSKIAEVIVYNRDLTTPERQQVEGYLNNKYNIIPSINNMFLPKLWLKADAGVTLDGSSVTAWADQSGNGNNATSIDTPTLSTVSGKTFVDFAGGYFTGNELITQPYVTIMCVARFSSTRDIEVIFQQFSSGDNIAFYRGFDLDNGFRVYNGEDLSSSSLTNNNQTYLFGVTVNNDTGTLYLNATEDGSGYCGEIAPSGSYYLGRSASGEATTTELKMAEIVIYNRVLTTIERQQVEAYLNAKYAIY